MHSEQLGVYLEARFTGSFQRSFLKRTLNFPAFNRVPVRRKRCSAGALTFNASGKVSTSPSLHPTGMIRERKPQPHVSLPFCKSSYLFSAPAPARFPPLTPLLATGRIPPGRTQANTRASENPKISSTSVKTPRSQFVIERC